MRNKMGDKAVVEILGAAFLVAMAVSAFAVIYVYVLSEPGPNEETFVTVIGKLEGTSENPYVVFEHKGGEKIDVDSFVNLEFWGSDRIPKKVYDLLDEEARSDGFWNIGEKLIYYPETSLSGIKISGIIADKLSNSVVFWGNLQEGAVGTKKGGIWHFNESYWKGTNDEVIDSSGNENHGTAFNGANTSDDIVSSSANRSGIFNYEDYDDYVGVPNSYSLNIKDNITIEAWFKPFSDSYGPMGLMDQFGYTPYITNITSNKYIFAIVSEDKQKLNLQTINITPHHILSDNSLIDIEYDIAEGRENQQVIRPIITHVYDNIYIVAYNNNSENNDTSIYLKTFKIFSNGSIEYTGNFIYDSNESDIGVPNRPSIVKVADFGSYSIFAIAYGIYIDDNTPSLGIIKTLNISHDGKIKYTGKEAYFDNMKGYGTSIIHVAGDLFTVAYRNNSNLGVLKTYKIFSNGSIIYTGKDFIFDSTPNTNVISPTIVKVSNSGDYGVIAIAYGTYQDNSHPAVGILKTIKIYYSNGTIISSGNNVMFESSSCIDPHIIHHSDNYFIVVYSTGNPATGTYSIFKIEDNGFVTHISNNILDIEWQNNQLCETPIAIKISERTFGIVFRGQAGGNGHPGYLKPIQIEYPSDLYSKGIYKLGSYGIYVNENNVFVNINSVTMSASINPDSWTYVVLTYDRDLMKLYINGILMPNPISMNEEIKITNSNLIFGDMFYGLIDEVAIYNKILTYQEVQNNFKLLAPIIISNVNTTDITYNSARITWSTNILANSTIRYGTTIPPTNTLSYDNIWMTSHSITLSGLTTKTTYYFEVQSTSQVGGYTILDNKGGMYYTFTTENSAPNVPRLPDPEDGKDKVKTDAILSWVGGDEDGDPVTYDVYLGTTYPPTNKISANQSAESYDPDPDLNPLTTYYWQIIAWDIQGAKTTGPIWSFTTKKI